VRTVAVLFADRDSVYKSLPGCDVYDIQRDATTFAGGCPVVAHPPCRGWGRLRHMAKPLHGEIALAPWAVHAVERWGGVLEHPAGSQLWPFCRLPLPGTAGDRGFAITVDQCHWGHRARKATWLYICGGHPEAMPAEPEPSGPPPCVVDTSMRGDGRRPRISHRERSATPRAFAEWLCDLARRCRPANRKSQIANRK